MKIRVKTLDRHDQELDVDDEITLATLRHVIEEKMGIQLSRQRLIFQGRPLLNDEQKIKDYGIADGLSLHMVERPTVGPLSTDQARPNIITGEMNIIRNEIFENSDQIVETLRGILAEVIAPIQTHVTTEVQVAENSSNDNNLVICLHIRGNPNRFLESGARSRIMRAYDSLARTEKALQLLEAEPFRSVIVRDEVSPALDTDEQRAMFGEVILSVEELLDAPSTESNSRPSCTHVSENPQQRVVTRRSTPDDFAELLKRVVEVQNMVNKHLQLYANVINRRRGSRSEVILRLKFIPSRSESQTVSQVNARETMPTHFQTMNFAHQMMPRGIPQNPLRFMNSGSGPPSLNLLSSVSRGPTVMTIQESPAIRPSQGSQPQGEPQMGIINMFRQIIQNTAGNASAGQQGDESESTDTNPAFHRIGLAVTAQRSPNMAQNQPQIIQPPFGPGFFGQMIVRSTTPGNEEATRRAVDAAVHAATSAFGNEGARLSGSTRNSLRDNIFWVRRLYPHRERSALGRGGNGSESQMGRNLHRAQTAGRSTMSPGAPTINSSPTYRPNSRPRIENATEHLFVGPRFPQEFPIYTNDPYMATIKWRDSLAADSSERSQAEQRVSRWDHIRNQSESELLISQTPQGETVFNNIENFRSVVALTLRRAMRNLAETDSDIASYFHSEHGEYSDISYAMSPIMRPFNSEAPTMVNAVEVDSLDFDAVIDMQDIGMQTDSNNSNSPSGPGDQSDTTRESLIESAARDAQDALENDDLTDIDRSALENIRVLTNLMESGRSTTLAEAIHEMGQTVVSHRAGFLSLVMLMSCEVMQIPDLVRLLGGSVDVLSDARQSMRRYLIQNVFNDNCRPNDEDFVSAADRNALREAVLSRFLGFDDVRRYVDVEGVGRVDIVASVLRIDRRYLEEFLRYVVAQDNSISPDEFGNAVVRLFASYIYRIIALANLSMTGNQYDYEVLLLRFLDQPHSGTAHEILGMMSQLSLRHIRNMLQRGIPLSIAEMREDIVLKADGNLADSVKDSLKSETIQDEEMECDQASVSTNNPISTNTSNQDEGIEWMPTINIDSNRRAVIAPHHSVAYLSGGLKGGEKASTGVADEKVVSSAISKSLEEAVDSAKIALPLDSHDDEIQEVLRDELDELIKRRVSNDPNYKEEEYPELSELIKRDKSAQ